MGRFKSIEKPPPEFGENPFSTTSPYSVAQIADCDSVALGNLLDGFQRRIVADAEFKMLKAFVAQ